MRNKNTQTHVQSLNYTGFFISCLQLSRLSRRDPEIHQVLKKLSSCSLQTDEDGWPARSDCNGLHHPATSILDVLVHHGGAHIHVSLGAVPGGARPCGLAGPAQHRHRLIRSS